MKKTDSQILLNKSIEIILKCDDVHLVFNEIIKKKYKLSDIGISTRVVSHWRKSNLLFEEEEKSSKNTMARFTLSEIFWLKTIEKLRKFGVSIATILSLKQSIKKENAFNEVENNLEELSEMLKKQHPKEREIIEGYISRIQKRGFKSIFEDINSISSFDIPLLYALLTRSSTGLLITDEEEVILWMENLQEFIPRFRQYVNGTHIYISFNKLLAELGLNQELKNENIYTEQEQEIINQIREEKVVSVKVILKQQKPKSTQVEYVVDDKLSMVDLFLKHNKDEITFSPKNGKKRKIIITKHNKL